MSQCSRSSRPCSFHCGNTLQFKAASWEWDSLMRNHEMEVCWGKISGMKPGSGGQEVLAGHARERVRQDVGP